MTMGGPRSKSPYFNPILRIPLSTTFPNRGNSYNPPFIPPSNREKQPPRDKQKLQENHIPPILLHKRPTRCPSHTNSLFLFSVYALMTIRGHRKLYSRELTSNPCTYPTRMVLPICLCHLTIHP